MFQTGMLKYFISNRKNISVLFKKEKICLRFSNYSGNIYPRKSNKENFEKIG